MMIKSLSNTWQQGLLLVFLLVIVSLMVFAPMASNTVAPNLADLNNHLAAIIQSKMALSEGQFPLRVLPQALSGLRYPFYQFYSPTSYTIAALIYHWIVPSNPYIAYKLTLLVAMVLGGIYMYRLALWFIPSAHIALLASVMYLTSPYLIIIINHIGAFNEALTVSFMPVVVFYAMRCLYFPGVKVFLISALSWYVLVTTHIITFLYSSLFIAFFLLLLSLGHRQYAKNLFVAGGALVFGCLLAAWYIAPPILFAKYCWIQNTISNDVLHLSYVSLLGLFSPGAQIFENPNVIAGTNPSIGLPALLSGGVIFYALVTNDRGKGQRMNAWLVGAMITWILILLMMWMPFDFWKWLPQQMMVLQYRWRLLGQMMWCGALLFAWAVYWLYGDKLSARHVVIGLLLVIVATRVWLPVVDLGYFSFSKLYAKPEFYYNENSYAFEVDRYLSYIDAVNVVERESSQLRDPTHPGALKILLSKLIPPKVLQSAVLPTMTLSGASLEQHGGLQEMMVLVNGALVATYSIKPGAFQWAVPITPALYSAMKSQPLFITFKPKASGASPIHHQNKMVIQKVILEYAKSAGILPYEQVSPHCTMVKTTRICQLKVPAGTRLLELPILYYPSMLQITLNGKTVSYLSVLHNNRVTAAVIPVAGQENVIEMQFRGLPWANKVSRVMWAIFGLLLSYALVGMYRKIR